MSTTAMSWTHELEQFVPTGSLKKGRNYFQSRAVLIRNVLPNRVEATVKGEGNYSVVIEVHRNDEMVVASCTCKFYENNINICKHIWAAVLEAESKGHFNEVAKMRQPMIETEIEHLGLSDDDEPEFAEPDDDDDSYRHGYRRNPLPPKAPRWDRRRV